MKVLISVIIFGVLLTSCKNDNKTQYSKINKNESVSENYEDDRFYKEEEKYENEDKTYDGEYCAEVTYYNSNTSRESDYTLTIEVSENELKRLNFPNGWLDEDEFGYVALDEEGYVAFTSTRGYDYTVQIIGPARGCFESVPNASQCLGLTKDGDQCENLTDNPSGYCWQHEDQE